MTNATDFATWTLENVSNALIVNYGMGVDSTAMLVGFYLRGIRPDLIIFSDVGSEKPETYEYLAVINEWLESVGFPTVTVVRRRMKDAEYTTIEQNQLVNETLPSAAYGRGKCSVKWKAEVIDAWIKGAKSGLWKGEGWAPYHNAHAAGEHMDALKAKLVEPRARLKAIEENVKATRKSLKNVKGRTPEAAAARQELRASIEDFLARAEEVRQYAAGIYAELAPMLPTKAIGYDDSVADRKRSKRVKDNFDAEFNFIYPLQDWGWDREECIRQIEAVGLPVPLKSACFFCPSSQKWEIKWLAAKHTNLFLRAIAMEDGNTNGKHAHKVNPEGKIGCGLGMKFRWRTFAEKAGFLRGNEFVGDREALMAEALAEKPSYEANTGLVSLKRRTPAAQREGQLSLF